MAAFSGFAVSGPNGPNAAFERPARLAYRAAGHNGPLVTEIKNVNKEAMKQWGGKRFRLRPMPIEIVAGNLSAADRARLVPRDDPWLVMSVDREKQLVQLNNLTTYNNFALPFDSIKEYRQDSISDGFLMLKSQLYFRDGEWIAEPF